MCFYYVGSKIITSKDNKVSCKVVFVDDNSMVLECFVDKDLFDYFNGLNIGTDITEHVTFHSRFYKDDKGYNHIVYVPILTY